MAPSAGTGFDTAIAHSNVGHDPLNNDVFGASSTEGNSFSEAHLEPSDVPRLRASQNTSGYREGITAAKASVAQRGFDEGFPLGAAIGMRAGVLLGIVEGLVAAVQNKTSGADGSVSAEDTARLGGLLAQARLDLGPQQIFSPNYWEGDGNWKYEVPGADGHVVFEDVATHHPMMQKWEALVRAEEQKWGITRKLFGDRDTLDDSTVQEPAAEAKKNRVEYTDPLQW